jgi:hypothetical protein
MLGPPHHALIVVDGVGDGGQVSVIPQLVRVEHLATANLAGGLFEIGERERHVRLLYSSVFGLIILDGAGRLLISSSRLGLLYSGRRRRAVCTSPVLRVMIS